MRWSLVLLGVFCLVLIGCTTSPVTCTEPYIVNGNTCCLDRDANSVCDVDENDSLIGSGDSAVSCDLCPPKFVTQKEEVIVYKYVCTNGSIMDDAEGCEHKIRTNAHLFTLSDSQDDVVSEYEIRAACRGRYQAAEIHMVLSEHPQQLIIQARSDPKGGYEDVLALNSSEDVIDDEFIYIGFCEVYDCGDITSGQLSADTAHVLRGKMMFGENAKFTRDILVDPTPDGEYGQKKC